MSEPLISVRAWQVGAEHAADGGDCAHQVKAMAPIIIAQTLRDLAGTLKCNEDITRTYARANELDPGEGTT